MHLSYTVEEVARTLAIHKNTVRGWLKSGLPKLDENRPTLVQGGELRTFLQSRRGKGRRRCPAGTCYCVKCREPRPPAFDMVDFIPAGATSGNLRALCSACGTLMHRRVRKERIGAVMPRIAVQMPQAEGHLIEPT